MTTHPDFEELFRFLEDSGVDYMIVGGYAVAFHGYPRFTKVIDIFFHGEIENVRRLREVLIRFGFSESDLPEDIFLQDGNIITFGVEPTRVDLMNTLDGISFQDAKGNTIRGRYGLAHVTFIGLDDLIRNKRATSPDISRLCLKKRPDAISNWFCIHIRTYRLLVKNPAPA